MNRIIHTVKYTVIIFFSLVFNGIDFLRMKFHESRECREIIY